MTSTFIATAFTIIDPIGMIPLTVSVTAETGPARRAQIVNQALAVVFGAYASALFVTWVCMRLSSQTLRVLGTTGTRRAICHQRSCGHAALSLKPFHTPS